MSHTTSRYCHSSIYVTISLLSLTLISFSILSSNLVSADNVVDEVNITVPIACTLTGTVNTAHTASINPGTYQNNIGTTTLKGFCNDSNGFAIYAAGYTGDEIGGTNSTKLVNSAISSNNTIDTGIVTSGSTSTWAMKLTKTGDSGDTTGTNAFTIDSAPNVAGGANASFSDYHTVPSAYTKVAHKDSDTSMDTTTGGVSLTTTYASFIAGSQAPGTYTGKVIYTMVHPSSAPAPRPKSLDTATTLQDVEYCSNELTVGQIYTLTDSRDGQSYKVARLADDNCWMLENLRLDLTDSTTQSNLTSATTNATDVSLSYIIGGSGVTYRDATSDPNGNRPTAGLNSTAWASRSQDFYSVPMIMSSGTCYNNVYCIDNPSSGQWNSEAVTPATINGITSIAQGKVGIYYNYCAASAGSYCYGNGTASTGSPSTDPNPNSLRDVTEDLCPIGWHMPTSGADGGYWALYTAYNSNITDFQTALNTPLSGYFHSGKAWSQGSSGNFWSSTWSSSGNMRRLAVNSTEVDSGNANYSHYGFSLRCSLGS